MEAWSLAVSISQRRAPGTASSAPRAHRRSDSGEAATVRRDGYQEELQWNFSKRKSAKGNNETTDGYILGKFAAETQQAFGNELSIRQFNRHTFLW
jgi:hypothetical protein